MPTDDIAEGRYPDREFFWGVAFTVLPKWSNEYTRLVMEERYKMKPHKFDEAKGIKISTKWEKKLAEFDF